jgi:flagellar hook assembly protein FlgD
MTRSFVVNRTLGFLRLSKQRMLVYPRRGGRLVASFNLTNPSGVTVTVLNGQGHAVRLLSSQPNVQPARVAVVWDGRRSNGTVVGSGSYTIRITARNGLGRVSLERGVRVHRVRRGR